MIKNTTVHSSRTIMFIELEKVMNYSHENDDYLEALELNVTGEKSSSGIKKTPKYLKNLYSFDNNSPFLNPFKYFWETTITEDPLSP